VEISAATHSTLLPLLLSSWFWRLFVNLTPFIPLSLKRRGGRDFSGHFNVTLMGI